MTQVFGDRIGRTMEIRDRIDPVRTRALQAALGDRDLVEPGAVLPHLFHWLYFWDPRRPDQTGPDGHPTRGGFIPPIDAPRRMWAAGRVRFLAPLHVGEDALRTSTIRAIEEKHGKTGALTFVTVDHRISSANGVAVEEEQTIVYRGADSAAKPPVKTDLDAADWRHETETDSVLLFRYSALTLNSHRIHYDHPYATGEEGYPGLVVHGPLQATLMMRSAVRHLGERVTDFEFRGLAPAFASQPVSAAGRRTEGGADLWVEQDGLRTMAGRVTIGEGS